MPGENWYTLWVQTQDPDTEDGVLAAGLTVAEAAKFISEYGNARPYIYEQAYDTFRAFELRQHPSDLELVTIGATVTLTDDIDADRRKAMKMIDAQTMARRQKFWPDRVFMDAEFKEKRKETESRTDGLLDRKIAIETFNGSIDPKRRLH